VRVLIVDPTASGLDFGLRCMAAGHTVKLCIARDKKTHQRRQIGDGLCDKVENEDWERWAKWADLIVQTDCVKWLKELDGYKRKGYPVLSPSYESAQLELIRSKGQEFLKAHGIKTIPYESFSDYRKAETYVTVTQGRYVSKQDGDKDKSLSYLSKDPKDMIFMLRRWAKKFNGSACKFMLQEFVPGIEFAVNGWLGKNGFCKFVEESFEHKKEMPGDCGQNTGETGTAIKYVEDSKLAEEVLLPLEKDLIKMGHTGSFDVSVGIDDNGEPRPYEITARMGWPAMNIVQPLHPDVCEWMGDLLDGRDTFRPLTDHAVGVVVAMPPFPIEPENMKDCTGIPVYTLNQENPYWDVLSPCEVMSGSAPNDDGKDINLMVTAGTYVAVATGLGSSVREARDEAYKAVASIKMPNDPKYRNDIGDKMRSKIPALQEFGYASEWQY